MARQASANFWPIAAIVFIITFLLSRGANCQWTLENFAWDFCNTIAYSQGVHCDCIDMDVIPGQGSNLCGYSEPLTAGLKVESSQFNDWVGGETPTPNTNILIQNKCDARDSLNNNVGCTASGGQTITSSTTTTYTEGLGLKVTLDFSIPLIADEKTEFSFSFTHSQATENGNSVTASDTCGPPGPGQAAGTCTIYTETYNSANMQGGRDFTYDAVVSGGVQMSFNSRIDARAAMGESSDGSTHFFWGVPISEMVTYGKSPLSGGKLSHMDLFEGIDSWSVKFHGTGNVNGQFLDMSTTCTATPC